MKKTIKILYFVGLTLLIIGILCTIFAFIFGRIGNGQLSDLFGMISAFCGPSALIILIVRLILIMQTNPIRREYVAPKPQKEIKTVDVKDIPKTRGQELYEQYENLYKQNLITKEDLDKKRVELLGK